MRVGLIGTGNMGTLLTESFLEKKVFAEDQIHITNRSLPKAYRLKARYPGIHVEKDAASVIARCLLVFLCVKPRDIPPLLAAIQPVLTGRHCLISLASPVTPAQLERLCPCPCIRAVPSILNRAGEGCFLITYGPKAANRWKKRIEALLTPVAETIETDDATIRPASDIVGCGPAFFAFLARQFAEAAAKETRLSQRDALELTGRMLVGLGKILKAGYYSLEELEKRVRVPGGMTDEGLKVLEAYPVEEMFCGIFRATHRKFREEQGHLQGELLPPDDPSLS